MSALAGTRRIVFEGADNLRDLGGYASQLGGQVAWGKVFRAGRLDELTLADHDTFAELGIRTIYDLRRDDERERYPDPFPNVQVCLMSRVTAQRPPLDSGSLVDHDHGVEFMRQLYSGLLAHAGAELGVLMRGFADAERLPALFHCAAGKDRTGIVAVVLLTWLGVDRETVLDDFELTAEFVHHAHHEEMFERMLASGLGAEAAAGILHTSRASMAAALDELDQVYGGIEAYLRGPAGLDTATLEAIRASLLT
jgi:protein-tyrosine phosphatase